MIFSSTETYAHPRSKYSNRGGTLAASNKEAADKQHIEALQGENQQYADKEALNQKIASIKADFYRRSRTSSGMATK